MLYEKKVNGNMKRSEESIMPVTAYGFPHHGNRSFPSIQDDALPPAVILNGGKNAVGERRETG